MQTEPISTPVGFITGRNAIVLKEVVTSVYPDTLQTILEISTNKTTTHISSQKCMIANISFANIIYYSMYSLDYCPFDKYMESSFDKVVNSEYLSKYNLERKCIHLLLSCYDHVIEIVCEKHEFKMDEI